MFIKENIIFLFLIFLSNLSLLFFFQIDVILIVIFFEILSFFLAFKFMQSRKVKNSLDIAPIQDPNNEIDQKIILKFFDQYPYPVFILESDFIIYYQNSEALRAYGENKDKDIISVIRDYDFISQLEEFKKNNSYNIFNWNKPLPSNQYFKTEVLKLSKFYVLTLVETTLEKNKDEKYNDNLTSLTHELKTPLSVIIGYLETINLNDLSNQENQKYLEIINSKTFQMKDLIDQTLKLDEIDSLAIQKVSNDLHSLLEKSLDNYSILFKKKGIKLNTDISESKEVFFDFTPNDFDFILNNLLSNALKYTPTGKNVYVSANKSINEVSVLIKDEGIGISQDDLKKITTKFFRADQSRNSETGGHGLGLAIVDKLLSKNGHKLEFSSTLGEGSSFKINISLS